MFIEYKRKGATTVYILQIFFPIAHQKHPLPLLLFFFSFNKRSQVRVWDKEKEFRVSKSKNVIVVVKKCLRDLSLHFEKKRRTKSEHPRVPFASSNPKYSLFDGRNSRSSRLVELLSSSSFFLPGGRSLWWSFSKSSSQVSKVSLFVSGAISLFNLSREKKVR